MFFSKWFGLKERSLNDNYTQNKANYSILGIQQPCNSQTLVKDVPGTYPLLEDVDVHSSALQKEGVQEGKDKDTTTSSATDNYRDNSLHQEQEQTEELMKTKKGIILHPQPTKEKGDPLNWPIWRRDLALVVVGVHCFVGGGQTAILAAGTTKLATEFDVSLTSISYLVGLMMVALAVGSLIASPTARIIGKRSVYLMGIIVFLFGSIGCAASKNYSTLLICRIISGFGVATIESLPSATIAEIYYAHERAYRFGVYTLLLLGGKNLVPLFGALVFEYLNRHWLFWIISIICGIDLVLHYFFVPETFWDRVPVPSKRSIKESEYAREKGYKPPPTDEIYDSVDDPDFSFKSITSKVRFATPNFKSKSLSPGLNTIHTKEYLESPLNGDENDIDNERNRHVTSNDQDDCTSITINSFDETASQNSKGKDMDTRAVAESDTHTTFVTDRSRRTSNTTSVFTNSLSLYNGRHTKDKWRNIFLRPLVLVCYPHVLFSSFLYSFSIVWLIVMCQVIANIFIKRYYHFSSLSTGLIYISPFVGGCIGSLFAGVVSDYVVRILSKRNHGFYEPEFRLLMCIPAVLTTSIGLFAFGWSASLSDMWFVPTFFFGILAFGCSLASTTAITLSVDSYKGYAQEVLVTFNVIKNLLGFIFSFFNTLFVSKCGPKTAFIVYGCIELLLGLFAIPLYIYGKRIRAWTERADMMSFSYNHDE